MTVEWRDGVTQCVQVDEHHFGSSCCGGRGREGVRSHRHGSRCTGCNVMFVVSFPLLTILLHAWQLRSFLM